MQSLIPENNTINQFNKFKSKHLQKIAVSPAGKIKYYSP